MANNATPVTEQDLQELDSLLHELKSRANEQHQANKPLLLGVYATLIKAVSKEVTRLHNRVEREDLATFNRRHKELRKATRESA